MTDQEIQKDESGVVILKDKEKKETTGDTVSVVRGRYDNHIKIYEISEDELMSIENGSYHSLFLNFSLVLLSVAISLIVSLLTSEMTDRVFLAFTIVSSVATTAGFVLLILWFIFRKRQKGLCHKIRERILD